jgi:tetratricopeptide (TPR) repeat protein
LAQRPVEAILPAGEALAFFTASGQTWGRTAAAQNIAEAALALVLTAMHRDASAPTALSTVDYYRTLVQLGRRASDAIAQAPAREMTQAIQDRLTQAADHAQIVIDTHDSRTLADGLRVMGEITLSRGQSAQAVGWVCRAIRATRESKQPFLEAYAWRDLGFALAARRKYHTARAAIERAIDIFQMRGLQQEVAVTAAAWQAIQSDDRNYAIVSSPY